MNKTSVLAIGVVIGLIVLGGSAFALWQMKRMPKNVVAEVPEKPNVTTTNNSELQAGGSSYLDSKGVFTFLYPNDYKLDLQNNGQYVRVSKVGKSQQGQTEMTDGVIMVFESIDLKGQTLDAWTTSSIEAAIADGAGQIIEPKIEVVINGYPGFIYTIRSFGESKYVVLQKDANSTNAVSVAMAVFDPQDQNYQAQVDQIISTIQLLK
ncbi:MAG: hypothetical protein ABI425_05835 [Patescibacteria group bacterium]